jgi:mono/diheme cytochrome c family protein
MHRHLKTFFLLWLMGTVASAAAPVDYLREIKPVFAEHCYRCHGVSQQKAGLRMDTAAFALKGGDNGPAYTAGKSTESLLIQALNGTHDDISRMPYKKPPLAEAQIATIARWIDEGAIAPADEAPQSEKHWAFVPPVRTPSPAVKQTDWPRNDIDRFILARLEQEQINPSPEADRVTLIRRVSFDLIGLPPAPSEVDAFLNDTRADAYERLVDRLLASPHYGERWGRHWLDVARYADSNGYSIDAPRNIWKYRDWVIDALNRDLPYDQFVIEQLAGDLLPEATQEQKIATGFHRNTQINQEGGIDPEQFRIESVLDRVNTTATAFLGLTVACAQCHDHKFDPISQREYYQLFAFLNNQDEPNLEVGSPEELAKRDAYRAKTKDIEAELKRYADSIAPKQSDWEKSLTEEQRGQLKDEVQTALLLLPEQRNEEQKKNAFAAFRDQDEGYKKLRRKLDRFKKDEPRITTTMVLKERAKPRESYVFIKGDFTRKGDPVMPGVLRVLHPFSPQTSGATKLLPLPGGEGRGEGEATSVSQPTRFDLARWIVDPQNPLTARVMVNRVWQQYFGRGLVETENDFGTQGIPPSHPELLDWLAMEFIAQKWSFKAMHRLIVTSATYRQSSRVRTELTTLDPNNKLLARQSRLRLDAEIVRDVGLSASGLLNPKIGGPSVFPPQPDGVMTLGQSRREWKPDEGENRFRRGMYTFFWRATPHPALMVFDSADGFSACTRRPRSNTPLQALTLLNDQAFVEFAQALAARILKLESRPDSERVEQAFRFCLGRKPTQGERQRLLDLLNKELAALEKSPEEAAAIVKGNPDSKTNVVQLAAWTTVSRVLLNLDETITRE